MKRVVKSKILKDVKYEKLAQTNDFFKFMLKSYPLLKEVDSVYRMRFLYSVGRLTSSSIDLLKHELKYKIKLMEEKLKETLDRGYAKEEMSQTYFYGVDGEKVDDERLYLYDEEDVIEYNKDKKIKDKLLRMETITTVTRHFLHNDRKYAFKKEVKKLWRLMRRNVKTVMKT